MSDEGNNHEPGFRDPGRPAGWDSADPVAFAFEYRLYSADPWRRGIKFSDPALRDRWDIRHLTPLFATDGQWPPETTNTPHTSGRTVAFAFEYMEVPEGKPMYGVRFDDPREVTDWKVRSLVYLAPKDEWALGTEAD